MSAQRIITSLLKTADVRIGGTRAEDIVVRNPGFYDRVLSDRELGLGESYMEGWWECGAIDVALTKVLNAELRRQIRPSLSLLFHVVRSKVINAQTRAKATVNARYHYNIGNDLYERMLDPELVYSCAYWKDASDLATAQRAKFDLICRKLHLQPGMTLLDVGCGWGGFLCHAVRNHGVIGYGISPAENQIQLARKRCAGLNVWFEQMDYRDVTGSFDRIVSIGMMEHVGPRNLPTFFATMDSVLAPDGMMLHHTIVSNKTKHHTDPFFDRYIFPGGVLPSLVQIAQAVERRFLIEDVHSFGPDYDRTLMAWHHNINSRWSEIPAYDTTFQRMWNYYLLASAAGFRARKLQLLQVVFRRMRAGGVYVTAR